MRAIPCFVVHEESNQIIEYQDADGSYREEFPSKRAAAQFIREQEDAPELAIYVQVSK